MSNIIVYEQVRDKIINIHNQQVIIDSDVAILYGVETKRINEAVKNNPERFPDGYLIELTPKTKNELVENFDRFNKLKHSTVMPKAFTEQGLYMLATILKSPKAVETTIAIIDTFTKARELSRTISSLQNLPDNSPQQKSLIQKTGELMADLIIPDEEEMKIEGTETSIEIGFPFMRIKKIVRKAPK